MPLPAWHDARMHGKPDYGLDGPLWIYGLGGAAAGLGVLAGAAGRSGRPEVARALAAGALSTAMYPALAVRSSRRGKLAERDDLLDALALDGEEHVLDVGCGRGLLLIGAARRLPYGRAVGADVWRRADLSGNDREATLANARLEGVDDRVELVDADARALPFEDASFDLVMAQFVLHNIEPRGEYERAVAEVVRVVRPGGRVAIVDFWHTRRLAALLREHAMSDVRREGPRLRLMPPAYRVLATSPL